MKKMIGILLILTALIIVSCDKDECPVCHECPPCLCS
jgi:hypothetical protein